MRERFPEKRASQGHGGGAAGRMQDTEQSGSLG